MDRHLKSACQFETNWNLSFSCRPRYRCIHLPLPCSFFSRCPWFRVLPSPLVESRHKGCDVTARSCWFSSHTTWRSAQEMACGGQTNCRSLCTRPIDIGELDYLFVPFYNRELGHRCVAGSLSHPLTVFCSTPGLTRSSRLIILSLTRLSNSRTQEA